MSTWNALDKSANVTLSGGSLTATMSSATLGAVRANTAAATGLYCEYVVTGNSGGAAWSVGYANALAALGSVLGSDTNSIAFQPNSARVLFNNGATALALGIGLSCLVCTYLDPIGKLFWVKVGALGFWNNSPAANPATGVGGIACAAIAAGPYFPVFGTNNSGAGVRANFGATMQRAVLPAGGNLDANTQTYEAVAKMLGYAVEGPFQPAMSLSNLKGYSVLSPFRNGLTVANLKGYMIFTEQTPSFRREYSYLRM